MSVAAELAYSGRGRRPSSLGPRTHKRCSCCKEILPLADFQARDSITKNVQSMCRKCNSAIVCAWAKENANKHAATIKAWRRANPEKDKATSLRGYLKNGESIRKKNRARYANDAPARRKARRDYYYANKDIEAKKYAEWAKRNRDKRTAAQVGRDAKKILATPPWADMAKIVAMYRQAILTTMTTGVKHQVDHIVPLKSVKVCGLHVHNNLQIITAAENQKKSNRSWPGML